MEQELEPCGLLLDDDAIFGLRQGTVVQLPDGRRCTVVGPPSVTVMVRDGLGNHLRIGADARARLVEGADSYAQSVPVIPELDPLEHDIRVPGWSGTLPGVPSRQRPEAVPMTASAATQPP